MVGLDAKSVWGLGYSTQPYPAALPILMAHLEKERFPTRVREGIGRASSRPCSSGIAVWLANRTPQTREHARVPPSR